MTDDKLQTAEEQRQRSGVLVTPALLVRVEGGLDLALSLIFYQAIQANWLLFVHFVAGT
jgi:hypothetical protein